jgi:hypothetical protein
MESFITTIPLLLLLLLLLQTVKQQNTINDDHTKPKNELAQIPNDPNLSTVAGKFNDLKLQG